MEEERRRISNTCAVHSGLATGCSAVTTGGVAQLATNFSGVYWPLALCSMGIGATIGGTIAAGAIHDACDRQDTGEAVAVGLPPALHRDIGNDRRLLRYVRGLHTGSVQAIHGGRLVNVRTTPRNFPRHVLESIASRVNPEAISFDNELIRQAASGGGKEDD